MTAVVIRGDARRLPLPDASVDLIVTSPPYYALRAYSDGGETYDGQIGSEATPREWLAALVECTAEWVRVLKPSGSIFVNLGDKYSGNETGGSTAPSGSTLNNPAHAPRQQERRTPYRSGMRPKSLLGLPWRYALACTDQLGLILRRDIIWSKPNGLPESVTDRCRSSHEYLFHFTVRPRYYAAVDEIREPHTAHWRPSGPNALAGQQTIRKRGQSDPDDRNPLGKLPGSVWNIPSQPLVVPAHLGIDHFASFPMELPRRVVLGWSPPGVCTACGEGRCPVTQVDLEHINDSRMTEAKQLNGQARAMTNVRSVARQMATITGYACGCTPYTDHPGTGESSGEGYGQALRDGRRPGNFDSSYGPAETRGLSNRPKVGPWREYHFGGWTPPPTRPAVVLDPFCGTGTTMLTASALGRIGIGVDRSADYCRLARWRCSDPGERAKALQVPKPPPVSDGQGSLFDDLEAS
jgi:DNA modification methylase